jgi:hypothetical protein
MSYINRQEEEEESFKDKLYRLELMCDPWQSKWDLSVADRAAIRTLLDDYKKMKETLQDMAEEAKEGNWKRDE